MSLDESACTSMSFRPVQADRGLRSSSNTEHASFQALGDDWQAGELVIVFGGVLARTGARTNELAWMTAERMEWHLQARACCLAAQTLLGVAVVRGACSCYQVFWVFANTDPLED